MTFSEWLEATDELELFESLNEDSKSENVAVKQRAIDDLDKLKDKYKQIKSKNFNELK